MKLWLSFLMGLKEIGAHKFRSMLTMLGVILGVASLLACFALSEGMARGLRESMTQFGGIERIDILSQDPPEEQIGFADISPGSTVADAEMIQRRAPLVNYVSPESNLKNAALTRGAQTFRATVDGCWPDFVVIKKHEISAGRGLTQLDLDEARHVCLIGQAVAKNLWPGKKPEDAVGQSLLINGRPFTVIGVYKLYERTADKMRREQGLSPRAGRNESKPGSRKDSNPGKNWDMFYIKNLAVQIPITTMFYDFKSANVVNKVDTGPIYKLDKITFQISDIAHFQEAIEQTRVLLGTTHRGIEDFTYYTREDSLESMEHSIKSIRVILGLIACICLVVGGIGIANIMLASITERIREIGVRRAIGAKARDIFFQVIVESSVIGVCGGLLGLGAALGLLGVIAKLTESEFTPIVEPGGVLISFSFAVFIGVVSGFYPAIKASRLDPIEALRYG